LELITEKQLGALLTPVDVIRDPLHGDIRITSLERFIIEQPAFQRLGDINQLGLTHVAYPGAKHNRFLHAIGTLHICAQMIATCNKNARMYGNLAESNHPVPVEIPQYCILLARLCALCHDLAHVPFGHTLENEGLVFQADEWEDPWRFRKIFAENSTFAQSVRGFLLESGVEKPLTRALLDDVGLILRAKKQQVEQLPFPFVHDLVGNTICADLIDYIQRDMYFSGLTETFGKRFLEYLAVMPTVRNKNGNRYAKRTRSAKPSASKIRKESQSKNGTQYRLVLLQYRYNERHAAVQKHDVIAEGIDLVRKRLAVAEKLYYHRTKVVASSMLITAAYDARLTGRKIWNLSDAEVLKYLEAKGPRRARVLARKLRRRRLFKPLFRASFHEKDDSAASNALWDDIKGAYPRFLLPEKRALLIENIEQIIADRQFGGNLAKAKGTVIVSCPSRKMGVKEFDMLVLPEPDARITRLEDSAHRPTRKEIDAIKETHENLWKLQVFVDPDVVDLNEPLAVTLAAALQTEFGVANEIEAFRNVSSKDLDDLLNDGLVSSTLLRWGVVRENLRLGEYDGLKAMANLGKGKFQIKAKEFLIQRGYMEQTPINHTTRRLPK